MTKKYVSFTPLLGFVLMLMLTSTCLAGYASRNITASGFKQLSQIPEIYECAHFLSDEECELLIKAAKPTLSRSTVIDSGSSNSLVNKDRTSLGTFLSWTRNDPTMQRIRNNISIITGISKQNAEDMQVLYYGVGAQYRPHYDYFDPSTAGGYAHYSRGGQRVATLLIYLNTPEQGGETIFPRAYIKVNPTKGKAVLFYNVDPSGDVDPHSLHGGAPVIKGEKWIATVWLRESAFR
ncbi:MAG: 2OG-Fe(II) oxygenase [Chlamydiales bacterium]|nr:2OG-Fe(II) oxygenase [Chlamydiales bacterium]